jgi:penicillin-binding protein 2
VAAKTGSAETGRRTSGRDYTHSWFAGYAPADDPEVAFVVLLEEAGYGGQAAAPAALEILRAYFETTRGSR